MVVQSSCIDSKLLLYTESRAGVEQRRRSEHQRHTLPTDDWVWFVTFRDEKDAVPRYLPNESVSLFTVRKNYSNYSRQIALKYADNFLLLSVCVRWDCIRCVGVS